MAPRRSTFLTLLIASGVLISSEASLKAALITRNVGVTLSASTLDSYSLDVDQDGTTDFTFQAAYVPDPFLTVGFDQITFPFGGSNGVVIDQQTGDGFPPTSLLGAGSVVGSGSLFSSANDTADLFFDDTLDPTTGNFAGKTGFVGLEFLTGGMTDYGYVQITVDALSDPSTPLNLTIGTLVYDNSGQSVTVGAVPETGVSGPLAAVACGCGLLLRRSKRPIPN